MKHDVTYPLQDSVFISKIIAIVCGERGVSPVVMAEKNRKREVVMTRQIIMVLAKTFTKASLATIGFQVGKKDHATVLHARKTVNNLYETDRRFREEFDRLYHICGEQTARIRKNLYVCCECCSTDVQIRVWADVNTRKIVDQVSDGEELDTYCMACEKTVRILRKEDYDKEQEILNAKEIYETQLRRLEKQLDV